MPQFRIKSPDGKTYLVNAPAGTTQAQAVARAREYAASAPRTTRETIGDFLGDTVDNIFPNWADEIDGAGEYVKAKVGITNRNPDTVYQETRDQFKRDQANYDRNHSKLAWGSTLLGSGLGIAAPVPKVGLLAKGAKAAETAVVAAKATSKAAKATKVLKLARAGKAAKAGALYGAVSGGGQGDGLQERATNAVESAALSAAVGGVIPHLGDGIQKVGRGIRANVPGVDPAMRMVANAGRRVLQLPLAPPGAKAAANADRMLNDRMNEGEIISGMGQGNVPSTPQAIAAEVQRRSEMGVPAMPADVTEPMRHVTSWASRGTGPGQAAVHKALDARKALEGSRVRQHVVDTMGPAVDPIAAVEQNLAASKVAAKPLYDQAYALPTEITPEMARIMQTPAFKEAVPQAVKNIQNDMGNPRTLGFIPQPDGTFISPAEGVLTTEGFDQVVRAMQQSGRAAADVNPITGAVRHNTNSVGINARAMDLRGELAAQNAPLAQAVSGYADEAAHREAMQAGGNVANLTGHEINAQARHLPEDAHSSFAQGARTALADQASTFGAKFPNGDTAANVTKSLGDDTKQAALEAMDGNRGNLPNLQARLEAEHQGNIVHKDVMGGSQTQNKAALDGDMAGDVAANLSSFSVPGVARAAIRFIGDKASTKYRNDVKARIAQVVTETNPANVAELMAQIAKRAQTDAAFADVMAKSGVLAAKSYGMNVRHDEPTDQ